MAIKNFNKTLSNRTNKSKFEPYGAKNSLSQVDAKAIADIVIDQCDADSLCDDDLEDIFLNKEKNDNQDLIDKAIDDAENNIPLGGAGSTKLPTQERPPGIVADDDTPVRIIKDDGGKPKPGIIIDNPNLEKIGGPQGPATTLDGVGSKGGAGSGGGNTPEREPGLIPSSGKPSTYVLLSCSGPDSNVFTSINSLCENEAFIPDALRGRLGSYWSLDPKTKKMKVTRNNKKAAAKSLVNFRRLYAIDKIGADYNQAFNFGNIQERYEIYFKTNSFKNGQNKFSPALLNAYAVGGRYKGSIYDCSQDVDREYIPTINSDTPFEDGTFTVNTPYTDEELKKLKSPANSLVAASKSDYNFYIKSYEDLLQRFEIPENELPNMYVLVATQNYEISSPHTSQLFSLNDNINPKDMKMLTFESDVMEDDAFGQYFDEYSLAYPKLSTAFKQTNFQKQKNILFQPSELKNILTYNNKKFMFPMYAEIKFSMDKTTKFSQILKTIDILDKVNAKIVDKIVKNEMNALTFLEQKQVLQAPTEDGNLQTSLTTQERSVRYINMFDIIKEVREETTDILDLARVLPIGDYSKYEKQKKTEESQFIDALYFAIFKDKIADFLRYSTRSYKDILNGRRAYTETFMYRIAKFKGEDTSGEPLQNFYVQNDSEIDVMEYIDTQVKYDQLYTYIVYAYQLVVLNSYSYGNVGNSAKSRYNKNVTVNNQPVVRIVEVPYTTHTARIYDSPPPPPDFDIISYKGNERTLLLTMNTSTNTYMNYPITIRDEDEPVFRKVSEKQGVKYGEKIEFSSDDRIAGFQIFRMAQKPEKYEDFAQNLLAVVNTDVFPKSLQQASSAAFLDSVSPNRKYYYMFRSIDVHGKASNPTEIVEVEIISQGGVVFALTKPFEMKKEEKKIMKKEIKRFVQIVPNIRQTTLDLESQQIKEAKTAEKAIQTLILGNTDNGIWGKKFKIRFVSKNTKKVLDLNVKFEIDRQK